MLKTYIKRLKLFHFSHPSTNKCQHRRLQVANVILNHFDIVSSLLESLDLDSIDAPTKTILYETFVEFLLDLHTEAALSKRY